MPDDEPKQDDIPADPATQSGFKVSTAPVEDPAKPAVPTMKLTADNPDNDAAGLSAKVPPKPQSPASEDTVESAVEKKKDDKKDENDDGKVEQKDDPYKAKFKDIETVPKGDTDAAKLKDAVMKTNSNLSAVVHNFREAYKEIKDSPDSLKDQVKDSLHLTDGAKKVFDGLKGAINRARNALSPKPPSPDNTGSTKEDDPKDGADNSPAPKTPGPGETANDVDPKLTKQMGKVDNESVDVAQSATSLPDKSTPGAPRDSTTFAASEQLANAPAFDSIAKDKPIPEPKPQLGDERGAKYKM